MKQISQTTFNDVVRENIEEFEMNLTDAIADTLQQFISQGIDISNLNTNPNCLDENLPNNTKECHMFELLSELNNTTRSNSSSEKVITCVDALKTLWKENDELRELAGTKAGAVETLLACIQEKGATRDATTEKTFTPTLSLPNNIKNEDALIPLLAALNVLCLRHPVNQGFIRSDGIDILTRLLLTSSGVASSSSSSSSCQDQEESESATRDAFPDVLVTTVWQSLKIAMDKNEGNKKIFKDLGGLEHLLLHDVRSVKTRTPREAKTLAALLTCVTLNDDPNAMFSQTHNVIRECVDKELIQAALSTLETFATSPDVCAAWILLLKQMAVVEDHCEIIVRAQGLHTVYALMTTYASHVVLVKVAISFLRNIVAVDAFKGMVICDTDGLAHVLQAMDTHASIGAIQEQGCATIAVAALRHPDLCTVMAATEAPRLIAKALTMHHTSRPIVRQVSLALRNLVARNVELRPILLAQEDMEPILRQAQGLRGCGDEAYAALRDLGCQVQLFEAKGGKAIFNPVVCQSRDLKASVTSHARAPFKIDEE